jgi:hypothetical protein
MGRNRTESIAGIIVLVVLGAVVVYSLRSGQPVGALPFLMGIAIREIRRSLRGTSDQPPPPTLSWDTTPWRASQDP